MNLLIILLILLVSLFAVVKLTERYGKPMDQARQAQLSRLAMVLIALLLVGRLLQQWLLG